MKAEIYFTADSADYQIGIGFAGVAADEGFTMYIDDFAVEDITGKTDGSRTQSYEAEYCYVSPGVSMVKDDAASGAWR